MSHYRWDGEDLILDCHLQPKASSDGFAGLHGDRLKIDNLPAIMANDQPEAWGVPFRAIVVPTFVLPLK